MNQSEFQKLYLGTWKLTGRDRQLHRIAKHYHEACEAYDLTVCTGRILRGHIMPANNWEFVQINQHAIKILKSCHDKGARAGFSKTEINRAIGKYHQ